jgi:hypothetical protein
MLLIDTQTVSLRDGRAIMGDASRKLIHMTEMDDLLSKISYHQTQLCIKL